MKVLLVYPDIMVSNKSWSGYYYYGIGYLSSCLKKAGHEVYLLHVLHDIGRKEFLSKISSVDPQLIGFSATTNQFYYILNWANWIKEEMDLFTICGGIHPTLNPEEVISCKGIDSICIGEGEEALVELCDGLKGGKDITSIHSLWIKHNTKIIRNPIRPLIQNLDRLPFPDRKAYDYQSLYYERMGVASVMASRGCPYHCTYCCNDALREVYKDQGRYVRFKSVDYFIQELKQILSDFSFIKGFSFDDDILPLNLKWFEEFSKKYKEEIGMPFNCNSRPDLIRENVVKLLKEAGCWRVHMGIESGNDHIRNEILDRKISRKIIVNAFTTLKNHGIQVHSFNMIGLPEEGMFEILETVKLNAQTISYPYECDVEIFYPFEKTKIYDFCQERGFITKKIVTDPYEDTILDWSPLQREQILFVKKHFSQLIKLYYRLMCLPKPLSFLSIKVMDNLLSFRISFQAIKLILDKTYPIMRRGWVFLREMR